MYNRTKVLTDGSAVGIETTPLFCDILTASFSNKKIGGFSKSRMAFQVVCKNLAGGDGTSKIDVTPKLLYLPSHKGVTAKLLDIPLSTYLTDSTAVTTFTLVTGTADTEAFKFLTRTNLESFIWGMYLDLQFDNPGTAYTGGTIDAWVHVMGIN